ncbi:MAG TPA: TolC family outer membrane protein [Gammaproteobacteria bacterium]|nr:TolC family outer membrane protein [Gammaproteobacteria bacterium]
MRRILLRLAAGALLLAPTLAAADDLLGIYQKAIEADPQLRAAEAAHQAALEARPQAKSALLPQASAGANVTQTDENVQESTSPFSAGDQEYESHGYNLSLQQALYQKEFLVQLEQADSRIAEADANLASARQGLVLRVAEAYFNLLRAQDNLEFAQAEKKAINQQLRQTEQRFEVGLTAITDVKEAQARYDLAVAQEIEARNNVRTANEALREITGEDPTALAPLTEEMPLLTPDPDDIDKWVDTALEQNPGILAASAASRTAEREIDRRKAERLPGLNLVAEHQYMDGTDAAFGSETSDNTLSLQLDFPFYQGGRISSSAREAASLYSQAQEQLEQQRRAAIRETRSAYLNVQAGISRVKALKQSLVSSETALEATEAGFEVGTRTAVDVLNSQQELFRARRDYAGSRYDYLLATLRLKQAAGLLTEADLERINNWLE